MYVFEAGDAHAGEASHLMSRASTVTELAESYCYESHMFMRKDGAVPLQAADLLAWEWGKYHQETLLERRRKMRLSLGHLLRDNFERYKLAPMGGRRFMNYLNRVHELGLEQLREDSELRDDLSFSPAEDDPV